MYVHLEPCFFVTAPQGTLPDCLDSAAYTHSPCTKLLQLCLTLCDLMDYSLLGSSVPGILQARILKWVAMPSSRGSP